MSIITEIIAWAGLVWACVIGVVIAVALCLCVISGRTERHIERWEDL